MCCDMKPLIVTMVEMHMLIVDVCVRLCQPGENVLMHYMIICSSEDLFTEILLNFVLKIHRYMKYPYI